MSAHCGDNRPSDQLEKLPGETYQDRGQLFKIPVRQRIRHNSQLVLCKGNSANANRKVLLFFLTARLHSSLFGAE